MKKYIVFEDKSRSWCHVVLNRSNIVGFRGARGYDVVATWALLDSGAEIELHGIRIKEAEEILRKFDEENQVL